MIVKMKKAAIFLQSKDAQAALKELRSIGAMHIEHIQVPKGEDIAAIRNDAALIDEILGLLPLVKKHVNPQPFKKEEAAGYWRVAARHIHNLNSRLKQLEQHSQVLQKEIERWEPWGDFDPDAITRLNSSDLHIGLYRIPARQMNKIPSGVLVQKIGKAGGMINCCIASYGRAEMPFKETALPKKGLRYMYERLEENTKVMRQLKEALTACSDFRGKFQAIRSEMAKDLEFNETLNGMGAAGTIGYVTGYIPFDLADRLRIDAEQHKWGILISDPSDEDNVPTLIRNPKWVEIIKPVFNIIQTFPAYKELDISFWFLMFFSIFYGILIGDAGYGLIFFGLTLFAHIKLGKKTADKSPFFLMYLLSSFTVLWGIMSGTFFGQEWLPSSIKPLIPALRDNISVQKLCFIIGALHLSIAHIWRCIRKFPSPSALSEVGWICMLWGAYFLANMLILSEAFPSYGTGIFITGAALVILFTKPGRNILKGIGAGLGDLLLNMLNCFTDIVSYIRLFAVGIATVAVADAFNQMAMSIGFGSMAAGTGTAAILFLGHALNIILGVMAILVHGVRLNMLEFSGHLNMEWGGTPYAPFKEEAK